MDKVIAKKKFGQNFLKDKNIKNAIVESANITPNEIIVEIGPGTGAITSLILQNNVKLIAYEIDNDLASRLEKQFKNDNFTLINKDVLECEFPKQKFKVIANIPYYITSDILFKLFDNYKNISLAIIMMQKEVADRLIAKENTANYSKLTMVNNIYCETQKLFDVPNFAFEPAPKVTSSVVKMTFKNNIEPNHFKIRKFIANCFRFRRKFLTKNLENIYKKEEVMQALSSLKLNINSRAQELSLETIIKLMKILERSNNDN
ncbi:16S rRNA (adenine(1518)-N(6)/adenine(1519)-N(6))-dimethyltransferase RsmA [Mycoplasma phocimorsus]|uniref:16S rRNA (adenine(1518)-N(6)/adenine(1519)-N(6))- dimethyltransferase RsmA n=1 Tax=Mycoplasma phocimorsus TaxID=3045839 RepID=UPI0024C0A966|nr:16S rRNA (adenine(1518)-N(6)/adenine(1519)-N(6))-dimethyltransferase RsmA [Mycoplasma phocimorsus]MDJ1646322.1 16S rRNA (adenine(1518)-N(6)/adenine(1519)-N(6))-dimethyltransferase RsmA [Mycoplasma phocimorsus]